MEKAMAELEKELKDLQEKRRLEELGIKMDKEKEYIPYPVPWYPYPYSEPTITWDTSGTGSPVPPFDTVVSM